LLKSLKYIYLYQTFEPVIHSFMKKFLLIFIIAMGIGASYSCYENPKPGTGKVIVVDINDFRVPSADVKLSQPGQLGSGYIVNEGLTNQNGEYSYTHEDPAVDMGLEVILNISATFGTAVGQGIIRIKPNETSVETVKIY
jgi:hypothetical protein